MRRVLILAAALVACDTKTTATPPESCDPTMREWILQCIEKANPHSDEEPEDNTAQCEDTATRLFCGPTCFISVNGGVLCRPKAGAQ